MQYDGMEIPIVHVCSIPTSQGVMVVFLGGIVWVIGFRFWKTALGEEAGWGWGVGGGEGQGGVIASTAKLISAAFD